VIDKINETEN